MRFCEVVWCCDDGGCLWSVTYCFMCGTLHFTARVGGVFTGGHLHVYIEPERCACSAVFCLLSAHLFYRKKTKAQQPSFCNSQFPRVVSNNFVFFVFLVFPWVFACFWREVFGLFGFFCFFWFGLVFRENRCHNQNKSKNQRNQTIQTLPIRNMQKPTGKPKTPQKTKIFETTLGNCWFQKVGCWALVFLSVWMTP